MKNAVGLSNYYGRWTLERESARFGEYYSHQLYQEAPNNVTSAVINFGRAKEGQTRWQRIKQQT